MFLEKNNSLIFLNFNMFSKILVIFSLMFFTNTIAQTLLRTVVRIPNIPGFLTLKCDFHLHTVFSDGTVWPHTRVVEAWQQGLDVIAITDHIRTIKNKRDTVTNYNQSSEIAKVYGNDLKILVIKGLEVTTWGMPPGHFNTLFLEDGSKLETETWRQSIQEAYNQGAFIFWNHPGWWDDMKRDDVIKWHPEHSEMLKNDWLHGIEIINDDEYYPEAYRWCLEKNLTILGNSDTHGPIQVEEEIAAGRHRTITLVFAKNFSKDTVKEALSSHRTAVYWDNLPIGKEDFLNPIFNNSITIENEPILVKEDTQTYVQITNHSEIDYELELIGDIKDVRVPEKIILYGGKTILFDIDIKNKKLKGEKIIKLPYEVKNLRITPDKFLSVHLDVLVNFSE
jgi:hypothetical protein